MRCCGENGKKRGCRSPNFSVKLPKFVWAFRIFETQTVSKIDTLLACRATDSKWHAGQELDSQFVKVRRYEGTKVYKNMSVTLCMMTEHQPENFTGDFEKLISAGLFPDFFMEQTDTTIARK